MVSATAVVAPATLLGAAYGAIWLEGRSEAAAKLGSALISFGTMCLLSNLGAVPPAHPAYDLCWSTLLPMSLAAIVLGAPTASTASRNFRPPQQRHAIRSPCVGAPFAIGAVGSVLGVTAAFVGATCAAAPAALRLPRSLAAAVAAALAATYIGGSANLFAVAAVVGLGHGGGHGGVLSSIAAADVFLMAVYFALLLAAQRSSKWQAAFGRQPRPAPAGTAAAPTDVPPPRPRPQTLLLTLAAARAVCAVGDSVQRVLGTPGLATAAITGVAAACAAALRARAPAAARGLAAAAPGAATLLLTLFFGAMGAQAHASELAWGGPALLAFSAVSLAIHIVVVFMGSWLLNRAAAAQSRRRGHANGNTATPPISLDDVLVASNANIGGPGTAGAFASLIRRPDLVVPAALWGTVGYAVASAIGIALHGALLRW